MIESQQKIKTEKVHLRSCSWMILKAVLIGLAFMITACAPSIYSINIRYQSSKVLLEAGDMEKRVPVTVAAFNDMRPGGDDLLVGRVVTSQGKVIPVIPRNVKPSKAVAGIIRDYLQRSGYTVTSEVPNWNIRENTIHKDWGKILIGGNIDKLEIVCDDNIPVKKYRSEVKLSLFFADVKAGKIFYRISATGATSLEHVRFSEEILEQQVNGALSSAIEDVLGGDAIRSKIREVITRTP
jgi:hypothetical protein